MLEKKSFMLAMNLLLLTALGSSQLRAQEPVDKPSLPLSSSPSTKYLGAPPLTFAQQTARYEAQQRTMRMEWNRWIGHSPLRPATNADLFMGDNSRRYYIPSHGMIVGHHLTTNWYW